MKVTSTTILVWSGDFTFSGVHAMASGAQIFAVEIEVLKEYSLWLFLGL